MGEKAITTTTATMESNSGKNTPPATGYDSEKIGVQELERSETEVNDDDISAFTEAEQKKIIRKIDLRLVSTLGLLYMCSLMDRTNLGSANIAGWACLSIIAGCRLTHQ
jgi:hypothetical protein